MEGYKKINTASYSLYALCLSK